MQLSIGFLFKCVTCISQTVVMHRVLETDLAYWRDDNIDTCFSESVRSLAEKLRSGSVVDIFFPQVNCFFFSKPYFTLFAVQHAGLDRGENDP